MGNDHFGKFEASSAGFRIFQNGSKLHVWSFFMYTKRLRFATDVFKNFFKKWAPLKLGVACYCCYHTKVKSTPRFLLGWEFDKIYVNSPKNQLQSMWYFQVQFQNIQHMNSICLILSVRNPEAENRTHDWHSWSGLPNLIGQQQQVLGDGRTSLRVAYSAPQHVHSWAEDQENQPSSAGLSLNKHLAAVIFSNVQEWRAN